MLFIQFRRCLYIIDGLVAHAKSFNDIRLDVHFHIEYDREREKKRKVLYYGHKNGRFKKAWIALFSTDSPKKNLQE